MPDVLLEPFTHAAFRKEQPSLLENLRLPALNEDILRRLSFEQLHQFTLESIEAKKKEHPQKTFDIERLADALFGPLTLSPDILQGKNMLYEHAEKSARIQQNLVHALMFVDNNFANSGYLESLYSLIRGMQQLSQSPAGKEVRLSSFMNGVKAQVGITKTFIDSGFKVFIPNYLSGSKETFDMDLMNGIDEIVMSEDKSRPFCVFVDAKSNIALQNGFEEPEYTPVDLTKLFWLPEKAKAMLGENPGPAYKAKIVVSTVQQYQKEIDPSSSNHFTEIKRYGRLHPNVSKAIIESTQKLG